MTSFNNDNQASRQETIAVEIQVNLRLLQQLDLKFVLYVELVKLLNQEIFFVQTIKSGDVRLVDIHGGAR
ncbi:MAG: hypothetical protein V7K41_00340 [Nostoc sp.]|uniref:hypothetical protein n=1 Tax=Nostoc sp. TaxID=1180 RepID=UPI002FF9D4EE